MTKSTITREQLEEWVAQFDEDGGCDATDRQLEALIRQSLAAMDSEPVAFIFKHPAGRLFWSLTDESNKGHDDVMPAYAAPQPAMVAPVCTCPSGDGSLRWPCPVHLATLRRNPIASRSKTTLLRSKTATLQRKARDGFR